MEVEFPLQTWGNVWKNAAAISGQYHNVTANYNIMLLPDHRLERILSKLNVGPREINLWFMDHEAVRKLLSFSPPFFQKMRFQHTLMITYCSHGSHLK